MITCTHCQATLSDDSLVCGCGAIIHAEKIKRLHEEALQRSKTNDLIDASKLLAECLELLPRQSRQHKVIENQLARMSEQIAAAPPGTFEPDPPFVPQNTVGLLVKGILRPVTLISCLLWVWTAHLVLNIRPLHAAAFAGLLYIHEMGHIIAMNILRIPFTWPVFVPLLGAFVIRQRHKVSARDCVIISISGPLLGILASVGVFAWHRYGSPLPQPMLRLAGVNALINGINLLPFWMLDGGRIADLARRTDLFIGALLLAVTGALLLPGKVAWLMFLCSLAFACRAGLHGVLTREAAPCQERVPIWSVPAVTTLLALSLWLSI
jgi:Zn-dependent protease